MDAHAAALATAEPLGGVGAAFYFSPQAVAQASTCGLDMVQLYGCGRGGVLGDVSPEEVDRIFAFFKPGLITGLVASGRAAATGDVLGPHVASAVDYANATLGAVDTEVLDTFSAAAAKVAAAAPTGTWPLADGYRALDVPAGSAPAAYWWAIVLRELRGGVHTDAVSESALSFATACQLDRDDGYFRLHGFGDEDRVEDTEELRQLRALVIAETDDRMAVLLEVLDDSERDALAAGAIALQSAVLDPVPVG